MFFKKLTVLLAMIALVAACGDSSPSETEPPVPTSTFPVTVQAANGPVSIPGEPSNIVSMSATHTEMLFAIGAGDQVVAVDAFSNYPPEAPVTDLTGFAPNVEAIVEYDADLVVTDGDWDGSSMATLMELGIPVLILPAASDLDDVYSEIEALGIATGNNEEAADLIARMETDVDEILDSLPEISEPPTFYHELDTTYYSVTSEAFIGHLYTLLGLKNIADAVGEESAGYPQLSEEYILQEDPDLIFLADTICCEVSAESLSQRPGWDTLTAVRNGSVVELDDDIASRWGPRVVEHLRVVADAISALAAD